MALARGSAGAREVPLTIFSGSFAGLWVFWERLMGLFVRLGMVVAMAPGRVS
jgi:hypothetical protein